MRVTFLVPPEFSSALRNGRFSTPATSISSIKLSRKRRFFPKARSTSWSWNARAAIKPNPPRGRALAKNVVWPRQSKTLSNIFARRLLGNPQHSIFFVGYADQETPAGVLRTARLGEEISLDSEEPPQRVQCRVSQFQFSAHAS